MYQGIAYQASHNIKGAPRTRQILVVPALGVMFTRTISEDKPRARWNHASYSSATDVLGLSGLSVETVDSIRATDGMYITGLGLGFHVGDDEAAEVMSTHELPRNVGLRYQRALDAAGVNLHGAGAKTASEVRATATASFAFAGRKGSDPLATLLTEDLSQWGERIAADDTVWLSNRTASEARGRGMGRHQTRYAGPLAGGTAARKAEDVVRGAIAVDVAPVATPTTALPVVKIGAKVPLPRGREYIARKIDADAAFSDVQLYRTAASHRQNIFLYGPPGTGKTTGLLAAFPDAVVVPITGDTEVGDLVGSYVQNGPDTFDFVEGPLLIAMREGRMLILDEIGLADTKVLATVYPLMDGQNVLRVTANPMLGVVEAADGFAIAGTTNPDAPGVMLSEALLSRFHVHVEVGTDYALAERLGCDKRIVEAAQHLAKMGETGELSPNAVPQLRELLGFRDNAALYGTVFALRNLIAWTPAVEREVVESFLREKFGDLPGAARKVRALRVD